LGLISVQPPLDTADIVSLRVCHPQPIRRRSGILISEMSFSHSLQSGSRCEPVVGRVVASKEGFRGIRVPPRLQTELPFGAPNQSKGRVEKVRSVLLAQDLNPLDL
jgi:hypothetical protein